MTFRLHVTIIVFERLSDGKVMKRQVIRNPNDTKSTSTLHSNKEGETPQWLRHILSLPLFLSRVARFTRILFLLPHLFA